MCFVWTWEPTAIISVYNINFTGFSNLDGECLERGASWIYLR